MSGWQKVKECFNIDDNRVFLYTGKIGIQNIETVKVLMEEGLLVPPGYLPEFIH